MVGEGVRCAASCGSYCSAVLVGTCHQLAVTPYSTDPDCLTLMHSVSLSHTQSLYLTPSPAPKEQLRDVLTRTIA